MGDGTKENPLTLEDVKARIKEHGGPEGLDLSGKTLTDGIDLSEVNLAGIILKNVQCLPLFWVRSMLGGYLEEDVLSHVDPEEIRSSGAHLEGARLLYAHLEGASLPFSHFDGSDLSRAHLEGACLASAFLGGACLVDAHLEGAHLTGAHLEGAALGLAHLEGAFLGSAKFSDDTKLEGVDWGKNYVLGEEKTGAFALAADTYRRLKQWYTNAGIYDTAGEFFFREMTAKRKNFWWGDVPKHLREADALSRLEQALVHSPCDISKNLDEVNLYQPVKLKKFPYALFPKKPLRWAWSKLISLLCGYGEKPWRVVVWGILVLFGSTLLYFFLRGVAPYTLSVEAFSSSLYYSAVSFTALGYGPWFSASSVRSWVQGVGAAEAIVGVFMIALFLVTFTRKMTR